MLKIDSKQFKIRPQNTIKTSAKRDRQRALNEAKRQANKKLRIAQQGKGKKRARRAQIIATVIRNKNRSRIRVNGPFTALEGAIHKNTVTVLNIIQHEIDENYYLFLSEAVGNGYITWQKIDRLVFMHYISGKTEYDYEDNPYAYSDTNINVLMDIIKVEIDKGIKLAEAE